MSELKYLLQNLDTLAPVKLIVALTVTILVTNLSNYIYKHFC